MGGRTTTPGKTTTRPPPVPEMLRGVTKPKIDNTGTWPLNPECNNAGTCKEHNAFQSFVPSFTWGKCECANTAQVGNFVYNDDRWVFQIFEGDQCDKFDFLLFSTL